MKRLSTPALAFAVLAAACAAPVFAQSQPQSADTSKPMVVKQTKPKTKHESFKGQVLNVTAVAITVRSLTNEQLIRTFTFSPAIQTRMQQIMDSGGYQFGDKVTVETQPGSIIALRIRGKPSKPI